MFGVGRRIELRSTRSTTRTAFIHSIGCPFCLLEFELFSTPWCVGTGEPSKICPHCEQCPGGHASYCDPHLSVEAPASFQQRGFQWLFVYYL